MIKRIYTWKSGDHIFTRGFIFGGYNESLPEYLKLVEAAKRDFPILEDEDILLSRVTQSPTMKYFIVISFLLPENTEHKEYNNWGDKFDFNY